MREKILVVGASGFLGQACASALVSAGFEVHCVDVEETSIPGAATWTTANVARDGIPPYLLEQSSTLFHFAWRNDPGRGSENMAADVTENVAMAVRTFEDAARKGVGRIIYPSSGGTIYGRDPPLPTPENAQIMPVGGYGAGKAAAEFYLRALALAHGFESCAMRISNPYGPGQYPDRGQGFIATAIARVLRGEPIHVFGSRDLARDYIYIDDLTESFVLSCQTQRLPPVMNIGSGSRYSIGDLVPMIFEAVGQETSVIVVPARSVDVPLVQLDITLAEQALGWLPSTPLSLGLRRTVEWVRSVIS